MLLLYHRYSRYQTHRKSIDKPYMWQLKSTLKESKDMGITSTQYVRTQPSMGRAPPHTIDTFLNYILDIQ